MNEERNFSWDPRMLRSLQYFETVARLGSVKAAADEVGVSPSAISHQLHELSAYVGEELVVRAGRGIKLTDNGTRLHQHISPMFSNLGEVLSDVIGRRKTYLRLGVCSSFGPYWLAPRLPEFNREFPGIDIELRLFSQYPIQSELIADAVVTADPVSDGFEAVTLFVEQLVPVISPGASVDARGMPCQLITTDVRPSDRGKDWRDYSTQVGKNFVGAATGIFLPCTHYILALAMARAGLGAALVPDFLAKDAIAIGDLVVLGDKRPVPGRIYKLCYKASRVRDPDLRVLGRWIKTQINGNGARHQPGRA